MYVYTTDCDASCVNGFASSDGIDQFYHINTNTQLVNHPGISRVLPSLNFTCNAHITRITFGGKRVFGISWPQVEIWTERNNVFSRNHMIELTNASPTSDPGVYVYNLPTPLSISSNDVISLYEPVDSMMEVYSERYSSMSQLSVYVMGMRVVDGEQIFADDDRPLIYIETGQK